MTPRLRALFFGTVVTVTDLLPPRLRYGYAHRLTRMMFSAALPVVSNAVSRSAARSDARVATTPNLTCAILADHLDVGGIGAVVEMLATGFASERVRTVIVCHGDGDRARRLRRLGIDVRSVTDSSSALEALATSGADVLQLHSAPDYLEHAGMATSLPLITVMHNTEIHYTAARWSSFSALMERSVAGVAVSNTVREYHVRRLSPELGKRITVVANGAPALPVASADDRQRARAAVSRAIGVNIDHEVLFICLARYDSQKNIAGTTVGFARATRQADDIHLVFAGDPSDWAELRRAESLRDVTGEPRRIHFLGNSDAVTLLTAGDAFLLNSFFEGWPVAATEASAAGLPLILSEAGGAMELQARDSAFSVMVPNPAGDAAGISDALVRKARRRIRNQAGRHALEAAVLAVAERSRGATGPQAPRSAAGAADMLRLHAQILREAIEARANESSSPGLP